MVSIDLKDVYLQVPAYLDSRQFLRFVVDRQAYQFRPLCFGLSTAPQVFTMGVRILQYLDDWLILVSSRSEALWVRNEVLSLCNRLRIIINETKSCHLQAQTSTVLRG